MFVILVSVFGMYSVNSIFMAVRKTIKDLCVDQFGIQMSVENPKSVENFEEYFLDKYFKGL